VLFSHLLIEVVTRDMTLRLEKGRKNQLTLLRVFEMVLLEVFGERLQLDFMRHARTISLPAATFLVGCRRVSSGIAR